MSSACRRPHPLQVRRRLWLVPAELLPPVSGLHFPHCALSSLWEVSADCYAAAASLCDGGTAVGPNEEPSFPSPLMEAHRGRRNESSRRAAAVEHSVSWRGTRLAALVTRQMRRWGLVGPGLPPPQGTMWERPWEDSSWKDCSQPLALMPRYLSGPDGLKPSVYQHFIDRV